MIVAALLALALAQAAPTEGAAVAPPQTPVQAPARTVAPGVTLLPGDFPQDRGPDGNTVIFDAPLGFIVFDTGRHAWHSDAILAFAARVNRPVAAIINSHWHLDHSSGNRRIKAAFSHAPLYATGAIDGALTGFLADNLRQAQERLPTLDGVRAEETRLFIDTMAHSEALRPDVTVARSGRVNIAGRDLDLRVTDHAVTDADIWLYDRTTHIAVLGDLVTLPAPFFETACSQRWREALDAVWATPFTLAIPGHGAPMTRAQFNVYRSAFDAFIDCVRSDAEAATCGAHWSEAVAPLMTGDPLAGRAAPMATAYVGFLREHGGNSASCTKP